MHSWTWRWKSASKHEAAPEYGLPPADTGQANSLFSTKWKLPEVVVRPEVRSESGHRMWSNGRCFSSSPSFPDDYPYSPKITRNICKFLKYSTKNTPKWGVAKRKAFHKWSYSVDLTVRFRRILIRLGSKLGENGGSSLKLSYIFTVVPNSP